MNRICLPPESRLGDPAAATTIANQLYGLAAGLAAAYQVSKPGTDIWDGAAAAAFIGALALQPRQFAAAAEACGAVAAALTAHANALGEARALHRRATALAAADPSAAGTLAARAAELAAASAAGTAARVDAAARAAPERPNVVARVLNKATEWQTELRLGAVEAGAEVFGFVARHNQLRLIAAPAQAEKDYRDLATNAVHAATHPVETAKALLDWDTWASNPARAAGHLAPDLVMASATGGAAAAARTRTIAERTRRATDAAAAADAVRRTNLEAAAGRSRSELLRTALTRGTVHGPQASAWRGAGDARLPAGHAAAADEYWRLSASVEPQVTAAVSRLADDIGAQLAGLEHRLKQPESLKRKLTTGRKREGLPLATQLESVDDVVRYTLVFEDAAYVEGVTEATAWLDRAGFHQHDLNNAWYSGRYRGINGTWMHPASGAAFELQFHTPMSWQITKETHEMYEAMRLQSNSPETRRQLSNLIAAEYAKAPRPEGVAGLTADAIPPPTPPSPIESPPNLVPAAAAAGALVAAAAGHSAIPTAPQPTTPTTPTAAATPTPPHQHAAQRRPGAPR